MIIISHSEERVGKDKMTTKNLKDVYRSEYEELMDRYQSKKERLMSQGILTEDIHRDILTRLRIGFGYMLEAESIEVRTRKK